MSAASLVAYRTRAAWMNSARIGCLAWMFMGVFAACGDDAPEPLMDLEAAGEFGVESELVSFEPPNGDPLPVEGLLWLPMPPDAAAPSEPAALVVFVPALSATWESYGLLLEHLVSHGYAVLAVNLADQGRDQLRQCARVLGAIQQTFDNTAPGILDPTRVALIGHSLGGKLALLTATFEHPLRSAIQTVIAWDPVDTFDSGNGLLVSLAPERMSEVRVPTLIFGTPVSDCVPVGNNHDDIFAAARPPSLHLFLPTADHVDWANDYGEGVFGFGVASNLCRRVGPINGFVVHQITRRSQLAWLKQHLDNRPDMQRYLTGDAAPEVQSGVVIATEK